MLYNVHLPSGHTYSYNTEGEQSAFIKGWQNLPPDSLNIVIKPVVTLPPEKTKIGRLFRAVDEWIGKPFGMSYGQIPEMRYATNREILAYFDGRGELKKLYGIKPASRKERKEAGDNIAKLGPGRPLKLSHESGATRQRLSVR